MDCAFICLFWLPIPKVAIFMYETFTYINSSPWINTRCFDFDVIENFRGWFHACVALEVQFIHVNSETFITHIQTPVNFQQSSIKFLPNIKLSGISTRLLYELKKLIERVAVIVLKFSDCRRWYDHAVWFYLNIFDIQFFLRQEMVSRNLGTQWNKCWKFCILNSNPPMEIHSELSL